MADTSKSSTPTQHVNGKDKAPAGRLLTPEPTPGVEDGRIAADIARRAAEAAQDQAPSAPAKSPTQSPQDAAKAVDEEIERIMNCPKDAYAEILSIDPDSSDADKLIAWRRLGCMTHPHHCRRKNAKDAFESTSRLRTKSCSPTNIQDRAARRRKQNRGRPAVHRRGILLGRQDRLASRR